jgi:hypothetical protein
MPNTNSSFSPMTRAQRLQSQIHKLETGGRHNAETDWLAEFDAETEELLLDTFGSASDRLESYKYATVGDAEALVNLPESAQEPLVHDVPKKAIQQRRQVLEACLTDLQDAEAEEAAALTGEDHEDPPLMT